MQVDVRFAPQGIYIPEIDLWLDPQERCENAWISHGHSDHARELHCQVIATPETLRIYRIRWPEDAGIRQDFHPLAYGESIEWRGARLTAYPASHILGAAQLLIEFGGSRAVYWPEEHCGVGVISGDAWRVPLTGSDCVVYHEAIGHSIGLPHSGSAMVGIAQKRNTRCCACMRRSVELHRE